MAVPKFKVGDKVGFKKGVYCQDILIIQEIRIKDNGVFYIFKLKTNDIIMEVKEDELELIEDYIIVVRTTKYTDFGKEDFYCSHFKTKEIAEEALFNLMRNKTDELMRDKDVLNIGVSLECRHISYYTDDETYLIEYNIKKED